MAELQQDERSPATATEPPELVTPGRGPNLLWTALLTLLMYVAPRYAGRRFARAPLWQAIVLAIVNAAAVAYALARISWSPKALATWASMETTPVRGYAAFLAAVAMFFVGLFFIILPFAVRPAANRATAWHVAKLTLLSTSLIYLVAGGFLVLHHLQDRYKLPWPLSIDMERLLVYLGAGGLLTWWAIGAAIRAASVEYRRPQDLPGPHEPRCDECGYDLRGTLAQERCPECGKLVSESLGSEHRRPSVWEQHPVAWRLGTILAQMAELFVRPLHFFRRIPLLSGHAAAHRWLALMLLLIGLEASLIVVGLHAINGQFFRGPDEWQFYFVGGIFGLVWAFLAAMMVGIETAGVTAAAWWRGTPLTLASASKVTSYASTTMLFWVFLGVLQILGTVASNELRLPRYLGVYNEQILTVGSLALANIGGLMWFELTVYRGLRVIQFANK